MFQWKECLMWSKISGCLKQATYVQRIGNIINIFCSTWRRIVDEKSEYVQKHGYNQPPWRILTFDYGYLAKTIYLVINHKVLLNPILQQWVPFKKCLNRHQLPKECLTPEHFWIKHVASQVLLPSLVMILWDSSQRLTGRLGFP